MPHRFKPAQPPQRRQVTGGTGRSGGASSDGQSQSSQIPANVVNLWKKHGVWPEDKAAQKKMVDDYLQSQKQ
jgi:hypothetical protein